MDLYSLPDPAGYEEVYRLRQELTDCKVRELSYDDKVQKLRHDLELYTSHVSAVEAKYIQQSTKHAHEMAKLVEREQEQELELSWAAVRFMEQKIVLAETRYENFVNLLKRRLYEIQREEEKEELQVGKKSKVIDTETLIPANNKSPKKTPKKNNSKIAEEAIVIPVKSKPKYALPMLNNKPRKSSELLAQFKTAPKVKRQVSNNI